MAKPVAERASAAVDIAIDCLAPAEVTLQRKSADAVFFGQHSEHIEPQLLKFTVPVRYLAQCNDLRTVGNGDIGNSNCIF